MAFVKSATTATTTKTVDEDVEMGDSFEREYSESDGEEDSDRPRMYTDADKVDHSELDEDEDEDIKPHFGIGLGSSTTTNDQQPPSRGGLGLGLGLGFKPSTTTTSTSTTGSLEELATMQFGSSRQRPTTSSSTSSKQPQRFAGMSSSTKQTQQQTQQPHDTAHLKQYGIGAKLLMKMGYKPGQGLGRDREGIAKPIDVKLRPKGAGLAYGGFDERTDTVKAEQKKMGVYSGSDISDDEDEDGKRKGKGKKKQPKQPKQPKPDAWKQQPTKPRKPTYKTADQIISETTTQPLATSAPLEILDMTGRTTKVVSSLSESASLTTAIESMEESEHLRELLHNLRLITDLASGDLITLTKNMQMDQGKIQKLELEIKDYTLALTKTGTGLEVLESVLQWSQSIGKSVEKVLREFKSRLSIELGGNSLGKKRPQHRGMMIVDEEEDGMDVDDDGDEDGGNVMNDDNQIALTTTNDPTTYLSQSFKLLQDSLSKLQALQGEVSWSDRKGVYRMHGLDEVVVAGIQSFVTPLLPKWNPIESPDFLIKELSSLSPFLITNETDINTTNTTAHPTDNDFTSPTQPPLSKLPMTPYESFLWNSILPKFRTTINNEWTPTASQSQDLVYLLEQWYPVHDSHIVKQDTRIKLLPKWFVIHVLEDLVIPKLKRWIEDWNPRRKQNSSSEISTNWRIHQWIFPWLSYLEPFQLHHSTDLITLIKQKFQQTISNWQPLVDTTWVHGFLCTWRELLDYKDFESILISRILPTLITFIRHKIIINPSSQDPIPITCLLKWCQSTDRESPHTTEKDIIEHEQTKGGLLPGHLFLHLLQTEFFPKWYQILQTWLQSPHAQFSEISNWYAVWKQLFTGYPMFCRNVTRLSAPFLDELENCFRKGLEMMEQRLDGETVILPVLKPAIEIPEEQNQKQKFTLHPPSKPKISPTLTFKDLVEAVFADHDVLFLPTDKRTNDGKVIYQVQGKVLVYIADAVLFVETKNAGVSRWVPKSVEEVVQMVRM